MVNFPALVIEPFSVIVNPPAPSFATANKSQFEVEAGKDFKVDNAGFSGATSTLKNLEDLLETKGMDIKLSDGSTQVVLQRACHSFRNRSRILDITYNNSLVALCCDIVKTQGATKIEVDDFEKATSESLGKLLSDTANGVNRCPYLRSAYHR